MYVDVSQRDILIRYVAFYIKAGFPYGNIFLTLSYEYAFHKVLHSYGIASHISPH